MSDLVVIAFPTEAKAEEVRQKLLAMQKEYLLELDDAVVAVKDAQGSIKLNQMIDMTDHGCGLRHLLGYAHWADFHDAAGWRRDGRGLRRAWRRFD